MNGGYNIAIGGNRGNNCMHVISTAVYEGTGAVTIGPEFVFANGGVIATVNADCVIVIYV
jgi:hypothetical protein